MTKKIPYFSLDIKSNETVTHDPCVQLYMVQRNLAIQSLESPKIWVTVLDCECHLWDCPGTCTSISSYRLRSIEVKCFIRMIKCYINEMPLKLIKDERSFFKNVLTKTYVYYTYLYIFFFTRLATSILKEKF